MPTFDQLPCPALVTDRSGNVQSLNSGLLELVGGIEDRWLAKPMDLMFPAASKIFLQTHVWPMLLRDSRVREIRLQMLDGSGKQIPVFVHSQKITIDTVECFLWVFFVSFERSRFEQELLAGRQRAETLQHELQRAKTLLERTGSMTGVGGWELDLVTNTIFWSDETCRIHGVPPGYSPQLSEAIQFYAPQARPVIEAAVAQAIATGQRWDLELPFIQKDGNEIWVRSLGMAEFAQGKPVRLAGAFQDITERRLGDAALLISESQFRGAFEAASHGVALVSMQGGFIKVNESLCVMLGYSNAELLATDFQTITHPEDLNADLNYLHQLLERQIESYQMEKRYLHKRGSVIWVLLSVSLVRTSDGLPIHFVSQIIDITDRKNTEATLLAAKQSAEEANRTANNANTRLQLAMSSASMGIWDWDLISGVLVWDERMYELYGITSDTFGKAYDAWLSAVSVEDQALANRAVELAIADLQPLDYEFRVSHPDGTQRWIKTNGIVTRNAAGQPVTMAGINYDITERKNAEATIVAAKQAAEDSNRAKSSFLATMSHEIRTPMNGILGMLQLLQHTELTSRQIDYTRKAEGATRALLGIINDILDFSKVEAGKLELDNQTLVIGELLRELSVILSANLGSKNVEVLFMIAADVPPVVIGDALRLRQVLINLAGNALKFTEQGEVILGIRLLKREADQVELEFSIRDTGIGIPADKLDYIFEGFSQAESTTSRRFGGTGLGLAISQRLVALMGGTLAVESEFGKGSCFFFSIRLDVGHALPAEISSPPADPAGDLHQQALLVPGGAGLRILIVDDNALSREILNEMASAMGWQVNCCVSGEAAMTLLQQVDAPRYDIVLMDWRMPGMDGWDTTRKIRQLDHGGQAPVVIMVTAAGRELISKKSKLETALIDGYLVKPITASMLYEAVAEAIVERKGESIRHSTTQASEQLAGLRLLVVEDNLLNQQIARELLERCGAQITVAGGGLEGVEQALAADPPFDAILMDVQMPDIDGLEATRRLRVVPRMSKVPIIAMTANAMETDKEACRAVGMVGHVAKPIDLNALVNTVLWHVRNTGVEALAPRLNVETVSLPTPAITASDNAMYVPLIDVDTAIKRMGGNHSFYDKVVFGFRSDAAALVTELQGYLAVADHAQAIRSAHTLRGLAATVGAVALSAQAQQIETALRTALADASSDSPAGLEDMAADLSNQLAQVLAALPQSSTPQMSGSSSLRQLNDSADKKFDGDAFATLLQELVALLRLRDMQATVVGEKIRQEFSSTLDSYQREKLSVLEQALSQLDFVSAIATCDALLTANSLPVGSIANKGAWENGS
jgi:two-component system sensor histidine kinase/response regulator